MVVLSTVTGAVGLKLCSVLHTINIVALEPPAALLGRLVRRVTDLTGDRAGKALSGLVARHTVPSLP